MKECIRERSLDVRQARRMVEDRSEWQGFVRENAWGRSAGPVSSKAGRTNETEGTLQIQSRKTRIT